MRIFIFLIAFLPSVSAVAANVQLPPNPGPKSLCPVCGMLVSKYPNWVAIVAWKNGHAHYFDGAKDMFKFLNDLAKYAPGHKREDISAIYVTEFYSLEKIDAKKAFYVTGSDVLGPMGHELVPLATPEDVADFMKDHKGKRMFSFEQVSPDVPMALDAGKF
jgi:copper chaperone NosL